MAVSGRWTRVRTLGRGASGAEVFLAADHASGELFAVKSAPASAGAGAAAEMLRRERGLMAGLRSPHVVPCIGGQAGRDGSYQLFLEFAPGGSLADAVARNGGRGLDERAVAAYAADVAAGLAYVHGAGLVHGDVKPQNVVIGGDGRAKLADFGCARAADGDKPIGGTPAFMAPEVARAEAQGPPADVWALGCTVIEMATGRAPWAGVDDVLAAVRLIGYTDAVPDVPRWLSADAKDFLGRCLARRPSERATAAQLLEHPFVASAGTPDCRAALDADAKGRWVSPKSTLDAAFWESDSDDDDHDVVVAQSTADRIGALACPASALPDWDSDDEGWIDVLSAPAEASSDAPVVEEIDGGGDGIEEEVRAESAEPLDIDVDGAHNVGEADASADLEWHLRANSPCDGEIPCKLLCCDTNDNAMDFILAPILLCSSPFWISRIFVLCFFKKKILPFCHRIADANILVSCSNSHINPGVLLKFTAYRCETQSLLLETAVTSTCDSVTLTMTRKGRSKKRLPAVNLQSPGSAPVELPLHGTHRRFQGERAASTRKSAASARTQKGVSLPFANSGVTSRQRALPPARHGRKPCEFGLRNPGVQERTTCEPPADDILKHGGLALALAAGVENLKKPTPVASPGGISCRGCRCRSTPAASGYCPVLAWLLMHCGLIILIVDGVSVRDQELALAL